MEISFCDLMSDSSYPFLIAKVLRCLEVLWLLCFCWTGGDAVLLFEVPSVFGWTTVQDDMFSTGAASNSGKPALIGLKYIDEASASLILFYIQLA